MTLYVDRPVRFIGRVSFLRQKPLKFSGKLNFAIEHLFMFCLWQICKRHTGAIAAANSHQCSVDHSSVECLS